MSDQELLAAGEFEVVSAKADFTRSMARLVPMLLLLLCSLLYFAVRDGYTGKQWSLLALPLVFLLVMLAYFSRAIWRARNGIRYQVRLTAEHIGVRQDSADIRIPWSAITDTSERNGIMVIRSSAAAIALPWYRLTDMQKAAINNYLAAHPRAAGASGSSLKRTLILWVVLIVMFVLIYNLTHVSP